MPPRLAHAPIEAPPHGHDAPVRGGLMAAVAELERVAASTDALQVQLSPLLRRGGETVEAFQALDEISQHLRGLAEFLDALAVDCPADWRVDMDAAAVGLRLHSQKLRLTFGAPASSPASPPAAPGPSASGELELW